MGILARLLMADRAVRAPSVHDESSQTILLSRIAALFRIGNIFRTNRRVSSFLTPKFPFNIGNPRRGFQSASDRIYRNGCGDNLGEPQ